jgi:hypothetical protein
MPQNTSYCPVNESWRGGGSLLNETLEKLTSPPARREFIAVRSLTDLIYDSLSGSL